MIIRKPYAFLIKKFRLIHAILVVLSLYLFVNTIQVFSFFNAYAKNTFNGTFEYVYSYVNIFVFIAILVLIILSLAIFYLFSTKKKPNKLYLYNCVFYSLLFIFMMVISSTISDLQFNSLNYESLRMYRDFCILFTVPQLVTLSFTLARTLGFNIKSFDFQKDIAELEIDEKDSEEYEVTIGEDTYIYTRELRKIIRYVKYFILENRFFVTMVCSIIALITSLIIFNNLKVYSIRYSEEQAFMANSVQYNVTNSYIVNKDVYNKEITNGKYYLLIKVNMNNKFDFKNSVTRDSFRLKVDNEIYVPKFSYQEQFLDFGEVFTPCVLDGGEIKDVVLVFEIFESQIKKEYVLKVKKSEYNELDGEDTRYVDIIIKPDNMSNNSMERGSFAAGDTIFFNDSLLGNTSLKFESYEFNSIYREQYKECKNDKCNTFTYLIKPIKDGNYILKLSSTINVDKSIFISKYINYPSNFYKYFSNISYRYQGQVKTIKANIIDSNFNNDVFTYIEVPSNMKDANKISFVLNIRGNKYNLVLK